MDLATGTALLSVLLAITAAPLVLSAVVVVRSADQRLGVAWLVVLSGLLAGAFVAGAGTLVLLLI